MSNHLRHLLLRTYMEKEPGSKVIYLHGLKAINDEHDTSGTI